MKSIHVYIEVPLGSNKKFEQRDDCLIIDRVLAPGITFPFNYGFVPDTKAGDGDPLDVVILSSKALPIRELVSCIPIGVLDMEDEAGKDEKIIAVLPADHSRNTAGISVTDKNKIQSFFETYKDNGIPGWVKIFGWKQAEEAYELIAQSQADHPPSQE